MQPRKKKNTTTRRKKQSHKSPRRRRAEQENLKADGKPIDDGCPRIDAIEKLDREWQQLGYDIGQLNKQRSAKNAAIVAELERAGLERYRTDEGRIVFFDVKKSAKAKRPPKAKPRKRKADKAA